MEHDTFYVYVQSLALSHIILCQPSMPVYRLQNSSSELYAELKIIGLLVSMLHYSKGISHIQGMSVCLGKIDLIYLCVTIN